MPHFALVTTNGDVFGARESAAPTGPQAA